MPQRPDPRLWIQQAGLLTSIPFVLLVGPAIGYFIGSAVERRWPIQPWGVGVGIVVGLASSFRVTIDLIRQARDLEKQFRNEKKP